MVLNKRIFREFRENIVKYSALMLLVLISSTLIVGFSNSTDCVIQTGTKVAKINNQEDGDFLVESKLDNSTLKKLSDLGVTVDESFYVDYELNNSQKIRLFKDRKNLNKISITNGAKLQPKQKNQIILDTHFAEINNMNIGQYLVINNEKYKIIGYGAAPDYTEVKEKLSDVIPTPKNFGIGFIPDSDFEKFNDISYSYSYKLNGASSDKVKNIVSKNANLLEFTKAENNPRIRGYIDDSLVNKNVSMIVGVVLFLMISFMISMSLINNIDKESSIIGALYSLGYLKNELLKHFMVLPIAIVFIGATLGTCLGFAIESNFSKSTTDSYSLPIIERVYSPYLFFIGIIVPILIVIIVNYRVLSKRLNNTPLQLLRKEKKQSNLNTVKIHHFGFITKFRLREFLREISGNITLFVGIFISSFLLVFGVGVHSTLNNYIDTMQNQSRFKYTYILKMPIKITENEDTERITVKGLSFYYDKLGQDMDVTLQGIKENSNFFDFNIKDNDSGTYISENVSKKFNLKIGDNIILKDTAENKIYNLKIKGIVNYVSGLYVFMNQKQLNSLLDESDSYFNGYLSQNKLNINKDYIYSSTTNDNMIKSAKNMTSILMPIVVMLIILSIILFIISMYLLLKLMIDKSTLSISLVKIFGFNRKEISKLYLGSSLYTVIFSSIVSVPMSIKLLKLLYPNIIANVSSFMKIHLKTTDYLFISLIILSSYFVSNYFLKKHVNSISLAEALKNRD